MHKHQSAKLPSNRQLKVGEQIRQIVSNIFLTEQFYVPELQNISITIPEVKVSKDLKNATIFVLPLGEEPTQEFVKALNSQAPGIQKKIAQKMSTKFSPKIVFKQDYSFDVANNVSGLLNSDTFSKVDSTKDE